jgi:hypothetical protein
MFLCGLSAWSQKVLEGIGDTVHLPNGDMAILEAREKRKDLNCEVTPLDPVLGFDLRFHAGYDVSIPLKDLAGDGNELTMVFRVTPEGRPEDRVYFQQTFRVPDVPTNASGQSTLAGNFDVGEGKYQVDWLMQDRVSRVCAHFWDAKAELSTREREMEMAIAASKVEATRRNQFWEEPPAARAKSAPLLNLKLLVNFAPQDQNAFAMQPLDTSALVTMLRRVSRDPHVGRISLVAFNIQEQRVLFRQPEADRIDFPALGQAIQNVVPGVVDAKLLVNKRGEVEFLTDLIKSEMAGPEKPDALIFAGPKYMVEGSPEDELKAAESAKYPLFYLNFNVSPAAFPWRDAMGRAVRALGGREYAITRPRDLWFSVLEMVNRVVESRQGLVPASR